MEPDRPTEHSLRVSPNRSLSPHHPLGEFVDVFVRREDAERVIERVRGDEPKLAEQLRIEEGEYR